MRLQWTIPLCMLAGTAAEDADVLLQLRPRCSSCPTSVPPTTPRVAIGEVGWCNVFGDPHIKTFDRGTSDTHFYNYGDYWMVKRSDIWVQARYWSTRPDGRSAVRSLAISEPRVKGAAWIINASGKVTDKPCDNDPSADVQNACPKASPFTDTIVPCADVPNRGQEARYFNGTQTEWTRKCEDRIQHVLETQNRNLCEEWAWKVHCKKTCRLCVETKEVRHLVSLSSAPNVSITVTVLNTSQGGNFLNVHLEMPRLDEVQSGHCGNFNGNADDDEPSDVMVDNGELLLPAHQWDVVVPPAQDCSKKKKEEANIHCKAIIGNDKADEVEACVIDYCSAGKEAADATVSATVT